MHRALVCVGSNRTTITVLCYDLASAYSMEVPVARRQVTPSLECNLVDHRLGARATTALCSPSSSLLPTWLIFVVLIIRCRQIFVCLIFVGRGTHENLSHENFFIYSIYVKENWPDQCSDKLQDYKKLDYSLFTEHGCLFYELKVVFPASFQDEVLQLLHLGHLGMLRMKHFAIFLAIG